ncbi:ER protein Pkr1 [Plasmodiophora brassicae]|uniref:Uncharacterized protein n=1 Tax=Plasmodiophora brassicae TaxID=37360 RepID=A0A0G4IZ92_PLABS|nr:hypothetical protein PBRA_001435 [Plasmodiophora brassicae]
MESAPAPAGRRTDRPVGFIETIMMEAITPGANSSSLLLLNVTVAVLAICIVLSLITGLANIHMVILLGLTVSLGTALTLFQVELHKQAAVSSNTKRE